jgi:hypothetical protein
MKTETISSGIVIFGKLCFGLAAALVGLGFIWAVWSLFALGGAR